MDMRFRDFLRIFFFSVMWKLSSFTGSKESSARKGDLKRVGKEWDFHYVHWKKIKKEGLTGMKTFLNI